MRIILVALILAGAVPAVASAQAAGNTGASAGACGTTASQNIENSRRLLAQHREHDALVCVVAALEAMQGEETRRQVYHLRPLGMPIHPGSAK